MKNEIKNFHLPRQNIKRITLLFYMLAINTPQSNHSFLTQFCLLENPFLLEKKLLWYTLTKNIGSHLYIKVGISFHCSHHLLLILLLLLSLFLSVVLCFVLCLCLSPLFSKSDFSNPLRKEYMHLVSIPRCVCVFNRSEKSLHC